MKKLVFIAVLLIISLTPSFSQELIEQDETSDVQTSIESDDPAQGQSPAKVITSLQLDFGFAYPYQDDFGGSSTAYTPGVTWQYHIKEDYLLGIVLARFQHHPARAANLYFLNYGFTFTHYIPKDWVDMGPFKLFARYGILLSQVFEEGREGRGIAHNTLIGIGGEFNLAPQHKLGIQAIWTTSGFPTLGQANDVVIATLGAGIYYRLVFE